MSEIKTLKQAIPEYLAHLENQGKKRSTLYTTKLDLGYLMNHLGTEKELGKILATHIAGFFKSDQMTTINGRPRSENTILQIRRITRMFLKWAFDSGFIKKIPLPKSEMAKVKV